MKKIYYLFMFLAVAVAFAACNPMDQKYKELGDLPAPTAPVPAPIAVTITLNAADYGLLPATNYAKTSFGFKIIDDAKTSIPTILAGKYPTASDKSSASVTYGVMNPSVKLADSLYSDIYYTPTAADYGGTYLDFSTSQAIAFLKKKYPTPADNQMVVLNYTYYESGFTPSTGTPNTIHSYLYLNSSWTKIYTVSPAQYASANRGLYNEFVIADAPNLLNIFNVFLKNDPQVAGSAKFGDVVYVSYNYYQSTPTPAKDYQRVQPLTYDGTNWVGTPIASAPLAFVKTAGVWVADNTVNYTLTTADMKSIGTNQPTVASTAAVGNLATYGNYNIQGGATTWTDDQIATSISVFLKTKYTSAVANQKFVITYAAYNGANIAPVKTFVYDGTNFVYKP